MCRYDWAEEWDRADNTQRQRYLNWASVLIRSAFVFEAEVDIDNDDRIRVATCEQSLWLMRRADHYPDVLTKGIVSAGIGSGAASATFSKDFIAPLIGEEALYALGDAGYLAKNMAFIKTMPLGGIWADTKPSVPKPLPKPPASGSGGSPCGTGKNDPLTHDEINQLLAGAGFPAVSEKP